MQELKVQPVYSGGDMVGVDLLLLDEEKSVCSRLTLPMRGLDPAAVSGALRHVADLYDAPLASVVHEMQENRLAELSKKKRTLVR